MRLTTKYALVGGLWGLALGYGVAAMTTGLGVAFLWIVVYGDHPWGDNTASLLYLLAALAVLGSILFCAALGYRIGWKMERSDAQRLAWEHHRANLAGAAAILVMVLGGYQLYAQDRAMSDRQAFLGQLLERSHKIHSVDVREEGVAGMRLSWSASGARIGPYRLELSVLDERSRIWYRQEEQIVLDQLEIYRSQMIEYRELLGQMEWLREDGQAVQQTGFTMHLRLTPLLDRGEQRRMPRHAAEHYLADDSPFHSIQRMDFVVQSLSRDGQLWIVLRDGALHPLKP